MIQKPEVAITAKLYSIAEQLKAIGNEGIQHYVNEPNKLQHEKLVELGSRLSDILDTASITEPSVSDETVITKSDFSNNIITIAEDLKTVTDAGKNNYLNPYVKRHYEKTSELYTEINSILDSKPLILSTGLKMSAILRHH